MIDAIVNEPRGNFQMARSYSSIICARYKQFQFDHVMSIRGKSVKFPEKSVV